MEKLIRLIRWTFFLNRTHLVFECRGISASPDLRSVLCYWCTIVRRRVFWRSWCPNYSRSIWFGGVVHRRICSCRRPALFPGWRSPPVLPGCAIWNLPRINVIFNNLTFLILILSLLMIFKIWNAYWHKLIWREVIFIVFYRIIFCFILHGKPNRRVNIVLFCVQFGLI